MPELPEVETIRQQLSPWLCGQVVQKAHSHSSLKFRPALDIVGAEFISIKRRGKFLIFQLNDAREMIVHLGMTGQLLQAVDLNDPYIRAWWLLDTGDRLGYRDVRRFGRIQVVRCGAYRGTLAMLGPEPFSQEFTAESLWKTVRSSSRCLKTQLLSQRPVAGIGNIYADEACFIAGVHPASRRLSRQRATNLHKAIVDVLQQGIDNGGTTLRDYSHVTGQPGKNQSHLYCYGRAGQPCVVCKTELHRIMLDARSTTFCPNCQKR